MRNERTSEQIIRYRPLLNSNVVAVNKSKEILGRVAEKSDIIQCATINDLMLKWNNKQRGIRWRIIRPERNPNELRRAIKAKMA